jgi:uncharacterized protein YdaU (DUF1376 family)
MAQYPALPLFTDAFIADTTHLTAAQTGAYLMLLMCAWRSPDCKLPDDDDILCRYARMDKRNWVKNKNVIMQFWKKDESGFWCQGRLLDERKYVDSVRNKNVQAGKASALKRLNRGSTTVATKPQPKSNPHTHTYTLSKDKDSAKAALWKLCRDYLGEKKMGLVGKWVKEHGEERVFSAVLEAQKNEVADPPAYITKMLAPIPWNMKPQNRMPSPAGG